MYDWGGGPSDYLRVSHSHICIAIWPSVLPTPDGFRILTTITEVKEDVGTDAYDPNAQAGCDYVAIYTSEEVDSSSGSIRYV